MMVGSARLGDLYVPDYSPRVTPVERLSSSSDRDSLDRRSSHRQYSSCTSAGLYSSSGKCDSYSLGSTLDVVI